MQNILLRVDFLLDFRMETFLAVCECMNFTKASQKLNITQPAVSQHIHYIEDYYGTKLFVYQGKKLHLTEAGEYLRSAALTMRHDDIYLRDKLSTYGTQKQELRLGATLTIGGFAIKGFIADYLKENPDLNVKLIVADTKDICAMLVTGDLDFALVEGYFPKSEYDSLIFSHENFIGVCSGEFNLDGRTTNIADYINERLIIREPGSGSREIFERYLHERNFKVEDFKAVAVINNINVIKDMVINNCGITFIYEEAVREDIAEGRLKKIPLRDFPVHHDFYFIWRKNSIYYKYYTEMFRKIKKYRM